MSAAKKPARRRAAKQASPAKAPVRDALPRASELLPLVVAATAVRTRAHAPYSGYHVGAALFDGEGRIHVGCNVENATYGATTCAERGAIQAMVAAGGSAPRAIVVVTGGKEPGAPCGICRQVLREFSADMTVLLVGVDGKKQTTRATTLAKLLPGAFDGSLLPGR